MEEPDLPTLDDLLRDFVLASDDASERALERLYTEGIDPAASAVIRRKLRVSLRLDNEDHLNQTGLDLLSNVKADLLPVLRRIKTRQGTAGVENFKAYVKATALNAFRQFLRDKYPVRLRLRNKIRYILTRRPDLALWRDEAGGSVCGRAELRSSTSARAAAGTLEALQAELTASHSGRADADADDNIQILSLIERILTRVSAPIAFEDLVSILWAALRLHEIQNVSDTEAALEAHASQGRNVEQRLDDRLALECLWTKICSMPLRHRQALLLNLSDERGDNLLAIFPTLGIASLRQIAAVIEYEPEELSAIWNQLPLDDLTIAAKMGLTRQQVINLRQSARAKLRRGAV